MAPFGFIFLSKNRLMKVETISLLKWFSNSSTIITPPERNVKNASINKPSPLTVPDDKMLCNSGIESSSIELTWSLNLSLTLTVLFSSFFTNFNSSILGSK